MEKLQEPMEDWRPSSLQELEAASRSDRPPAALAGGPDHRVPGVFVQGRLPTLVCSRQLLFDPAAPRPLRIFLA